MIRVFEAWETMSGSAFFESTRLAEQQANPAATLVKRLFEVHASTWEEAMSIYHLRMGWEPYVPGGEPEPCPRCEAFFYPDGSGECWRCGKIC
jgi:hypothetical protein